MNNVVLIGRLTRDVELRYSQAGTAMGSFNLAVDKGLSKDKKQELEQKGQPTADFINVMTYGKTAEMANEYLSKGMQVALRGRITTRSYEDKEGVKRYVTEVIADNLEFIEWKDRRQGSSGGFDDYKTSDEEFPF